MYKHPYARRDVRPFQSREEAAEACKRYLDSVEKHKEDPTYPVDDEFLVRHTLFLHRLCQVAVSPHIYDDMFQELTVELTMRARTWKPELANFTTYAFNAIRTRASRFLKKIRKHAVEEGHHNLERLAYEEESSGAYLAQEVPTVYNDFLGSVNPDYMDMVQMVLEGHTIQEIAREFNTSVKAVSSKIETFIKEYFNRG